jgi:two-component system chemotaxis response regulator CheB
VVQDPAEAFAPDMPRNAIIAAAPDHVVGVDEIAPLIVSLSREEAPLGRPPSPQLQIEVETAAGGPLGSERLSEIAEPTALSCPECSGVLSELKSEGPLRYRCQIGHAYTAEIMEARQESALERAMMVALRIVEERLTLVTRMIEEARAQGNTAAADLHEARARDYQEQAAILRRAVAATIRQRDQSNSESGPDEEADAA